MKYSFLNQPLTFVEVGCRKNAWLPLREIASHVRAFVIEPDAREGEILRKNLSHKSWHSWQVIPYAAGSQEGGVETLFLTAQGGLSSLYPPHYDLIGQFEDEDPYRITDSVEMRTRRLENLAKEYGFEQGIDLLKIDTQGSEYHILKGAGDLLKNTLAIYVETEFVPLYKGQPLFGDIHALLSSYGFYLHDILRVRRSRRTFPAYTRPQLLYGFCLYAREPKKEDERERLAGIMASLGYFDYAAALVSPAREELIAHSHAHAALRKIPRAIQTQTLYHDRKNEYTI